LYFGIIGVVLATFQKIGRFFSKSSGHPAPILAQPGELVLKADGQHCSLSFKSGHFTNSLFTSFTFSPISNPTSDASINCI
jgi:hypothetical protein